MINRDKVIKGLEHHLSEITIGKKCFQCPYYGDNPCEQILIASALELLKEQEPKPVKNIDDSEVGIRSGFCPKCQKLIYYNILHPAEFCKYCGQAVKWYS